MPGDLSWRLGARLEPKARIFVILVTFPGQKGVPFWLRVWYFLDAFFGVFLSMCFFRFSVILDAKSIQNGRPLEVILRSFLGTGDFLIFDTPIVRNAIF